MKLEIEINDNTRQTLDDLGRSNPFAADALLQTLNDSCTCEAPDQIILNKSQVALLVLLSDLGFKMVAAYQAHLLRAKGIDPFGSDPLIDVLMDILGVGKDFQKKKDETKEKGEGPSLK